MNRRAYGALVLGWAVGVGLAFALVGIYGITEATQFYMAGLSLLGLWVGGLVYLRVTK